MAYRVMPVCHCVYPMSLAWLVCKWCYAMVCNGQVLVHEQTAIHLDQGCHSFLSFVLLLGIVPSPYDQSMHANRLQAVCQPSCGGLCRNDNIWKVDLHGQHVPEAIQMVERTIRNLSVFEGVLYACIPHFSLYITSVASMVCNMWVEGMLLPTCMTAVPMAPLY